MNELRPPFLILLLVAWLPSAPSMAGDEWLRPDPLAFEHSFPAPRELNGEQTREELEPFFRDYMCGFSAQIIWADFWHFDLQYGGDLRLDPQTLWEVVQEQERPWKEVGFLFVGRQGLTQFIPELESHLERELRRPPDEDHNDRRRELRTLGGALARLHRQRGDVDAVLELLDRSDPWARAGAVLEIADWADDRVQEKLSTLHRAGELGIPLLLPPIERYQEWLVRWRDATGIRDRLDVLFLAMRRARTHPMGTPAGRWARAMLIELAHSEPEIVEWFCREKLRGRVAADTADLRLSRWIIVELLKRPLPIPDDEEKRNR